MIQDLSQGRDLRNDNAIFIEQKNFDEEGWKLKPEIAKQLNQRFGDEVMFFRCISNGTECSGHGWIETKEGDVTQWG